MQFGKVENAHLIDFSLPTTPIQTKTILKETNNNKNQPNIYIGCAKWNAQDLKHFYPRGTKDELAYYSSQFNCIEMNSSFYRIFPTSQFKIWKGKTPPEFRFFPKIYQGISHQNRLKDCQQFISAYANSVQQLGNQLEMCFLQMNEHFAPTNDHFNRLELFFQQWSQTNIPLALELRHTDWFNHATTATNLYQLLTQYKITNIITDTAGRRDLLHMRLTTNAAFIRYVGANHPTDYSRIDDWVIRLREWIHFGLSNIYFFVHQNNEIESVKISRYFIKQLNQELNINLKLPRVLPEQQSLF